MITVILSLTRTYCPRKSGISYVTGTTDELCLSGTAEELRFEETEQVHMNMRAPRTGRRLSDIGLFKEVTVKVRD